MSGKLKITFLADAGVIPGGDRQLEGDPEEIITEYHVVEALRFLGHTVSVVGVHDDIRAIVDAITSQEPELVFNLTEQFSGLRYMDKNVAAVLEMMEIPFTGTGTIGMMLCRDKRLCKELLAHHRIRVPGFVSIPRHRRVRIPKSIRYPLVVKPALEDGSEGISNASLVWDESALTERAAFVHERWEQDVIAEEYIEGRELYVSIVGNKRLVVYPMRECFLNRQGRGGPNLATYRVKWNDAYRKKWGIKFGYADLDAETEKRIGRACKKVYRLLHLQDYGRIDLRLTPDGKLVILEANPNPALAYGEEVAESAEKAGVTYEQLIDRIIQAALRRCGCREDQRGITPTLLRME